MKFVASVVLPKGKKSNIRHCILPLTDEIISICGDYDKKNDNRGRYPVLITHEQNIHGMLEKFDLILWPKLSSKMEADHIMIGIDAANALRANIGETVEITRADSNLWENCKTLTWALKTDIDHEKLQKVIRKIRVELANSFVRIDPSQSITIDDWLIIDAEGGEPPHTRFLMITDSTIHRMHVTPMHIQTDTILLVDATRSMMRSDKGTFEPNRFKVALDAIQNFFDIKSRQVGLDHVGVYLFTDRVIKDSKYVFELQHCDEKGIEKLREFLSNIHTFPTGWTSISDAIIDATNILRSNSNSKKGKLIVLLTDGMHTVDSRQYIRNHPNASHPSLEEAMNYAKKNNTQVTIVIIGNQKQLDNQRLEHLANLVTSIGGFIKQPVGSRELISLYSSLANGYIISFKE